MAQFWKGGGLEAPSQIPRKTSRARFLKESNPEVYWDTSMGPIPCFVQKLDYTSHAPRKKPLLSKGQRVAVFLSFFLLYEILWDCIWHCMQPWKACVQGKRHDHDNVHHTVITQTCSYVGIVLLAGVWGNLFFQRISELTIISTWSCSVTFHLILSSSPRLAFPCTMVSLPTQQNLWPCGLKTAWYPL